MEQTFAIIKPDAFAAGDAGKILARIYAEGFKVAGIKKLYMSKVEAEGFYYVHKERPFFRDLVDFMVARVLDHLAVSRAWDVITVGDGVGATAEHLGDLQTADFRADRQCLHLFHGASCSLPSSLMVHCHSPSQISVPASR